MDRVEEVVNFALDDDMYVIINVHHDTGTNGWLKASNTNIAAKRHGLKNMAADSSPLKIMMKGLCLKASMKLLMMTMNGMHHLLQILKQHILQLTH